MTHVQPLRHLAVLLLAVLPAPGLRAEAPILLAEPARASVVVQDSRPLDFVEHDGRVMFTAERSDLGRALFVSDGTPAGTKVLHELTPGPEDARILPIDVLGQELFFFAKTLSHGWELWATDATPAGTRLVADMLPGPRSGGIDLIRFEDGFLFGAGEPESGHELFRTDGTADGTELVADLVPGPEPSGASWFGKLGELLLFGARHEALGYELWRSDGTEDGTTLVKDLNPGESGGFSEGTVVAGGIAYFEAYTPDTGLEAWRSDGTEAGTFMLRDIGPGAEDAGLHSLTPFGDALIFATWSDAGHQLWRSDGTTAGTVPLATFPALSDGIDEILIADGHAFFSAEPSYCERGMWVTDGTAAGTRPVDPARPDHPRVRAWDERAVHDDGLLYFPARAGESRQLWATDGTAAGTRLVAEIGPEGSDTDIRELTSATGLLWFSGCTEPSGCEPWTSDTTAAGTRLLLDIQPTLRTPDRLERPVVAGDRLHLVEPGPNRSAKRVWKTDGTASGTARLTDEGDWLVAAEHVEGADLYLWTAPSGPLHRSTSLGLERIPGVTASSLATVEDGVLVGTSAAPRLHRPSDGSWTTLDGFESASRLHAAGSRVFFNGTAQSGESGLWAWSETGERFLGDATLGAVASAWRDRLVFSDGGAAWISDGTSAGTHPLGGPRTWSGTRFVRLDDSVVFNPQRSVVWGQELWSSDGTPDSAVLLADVNPATLDSEPAELTAARGCVYFTATDGVSGRELWISDDSGTRLVADLHPGPFGSNPYGLAPVPGTRWLLFSAWTPETGTELWLTDGTDDGTRLAHEFAAGPTSSTPSATAVLGERVVLGADPDGGGQDLWSLALGPGSVPAVDGGGSAALRVQRTGGVLELDWSTGCGAATDYTVSEGPLASPFDAHAPIACTTLGATEFSTTPAGGSRYYLITAQDGSSEGPAGRDSLGRLRRAAGRCLPELPLGCAP